MGARQDGPFAHLTAAPRCCRVSPMPCLRAPAAAACALVGLVDVLRESAGQAGTDRSFAGAFRSASPGWIVGARHCPQRGAHARRPRHAEAL